MLPPPAPHWRFKFYTTLILGMPIAIIIGQACGSVVRDYLSGVGR